MKWLSPFGRYKLEDFDSEYISLDQAIDQSIVFVEKNRQESANTFVKDNSTAESGQVKAADAKVSLDSAGNTTDYGGVAGPLALQPLRAEVEADIPASGHDTAYARKSTTVNKAVQDIEMGSYQWQLFVLCGFE